MWVFGSVARGETSPTSDIDILQVVDEAKEPLAIGRIQVAPYTFNRLKEMATAGSLFVAHLIEEAQAIHDPEDLLSGLRGAYEYVPLDAELRKLRVTSLLLDVSSTFYGEYWPGLHKCAAFVLRSLGYVRAREQGCSSFSLPRVTEVLGDPRLGDILTLRNLTEQRETLFRSSIRMIEEYQGLPVRNPFGSVEALTINAWSSYDMAAAWGLRILTKDKVRLIYG